jgi:hypothetical protein
MSTSVAENSLSLVAFVISLLAAICLIVVVVIASSTAIRWRFNASAKTKFLSLNMLHEISATVKAWYFLVSKFKDLGLDLKEILVDPRIQEADAKRRVRTLELLSRILQAGNFYVLFLQEIHPSILEAVMELLRQMGYTPFATKVAHNEYVLVATRDDPESWKISFPLMGIAMTAMFSFSRGLELFGSVHIPFSNAVIQAGGGGKKLNKWVRLFDAISLFGLIPTWIAGDFNTSAQYFPSSFGTGKLITPDVPTSFGGPVASKRIDASKFHRFMEECLLGEREGHGIDGVWSTVEMSGDIRLQENPSGLSPLEMFHLPLLRFINHDEFPSRKELELKDGEELKDAKKEEFILFFEWALDNGYSDHFAVVGW